MDASALSPPSRPHGVCELGSPVWRGWHSWQYPMDDGHMPLCRKLLPDPLGYMRRLALPHGRKAVRAYRNVSDLFEFPRCLGRADTRDRVACLVDLPDQRDLCCGRWGLFHGLAYGSALTSSPGRAPIAPRLNRFRAQVENAIQHHSFIQKPIRPGALLQRSMAHAQGSLWFHPPKRGFHHLSAPDLFCGSPGPPAKRGRSGLRRSHLCR